MAKSIWEEMIEDPEFENFFPATPLQREALGAVFAEDLYQTLSQEGFTATVIPRIPRTGREALDDWLESRNAHNTGCRVDYEDWY